MIRMTNISAAQQSKNRTHDGLLTIGDLRRRRIDIYFQCDNCENNGIFILREKLLSDAEPASIFEEITCKSCQSGQLTCKSVAAEKQVDSGQAAEQSNFEKLKKYDYAIKIIDLVAAIAKRVFPIEEIVQFSRLDTTYLYWAIRNRLKEDPDRAITQEECVELKEKTLWIRNFDQSHPNDKNPETFAQRL